MVEAFQVLATVISSCISSDIHVTAHKQALYHTYQAMCAGTRPAAGYAQAPCHRARRLHRPLHISHSQLSLDPVTCWYCGAQKESPLFSSLQLPLPLPPSLPTYLHPSEREGERERGGGRNRETDRQIDRERERVRQRKRGREGGRERQVLYGVPYSEHSSFRELRAFVAAVPARRIVPTVGGGGGDTARRLVAQLTTT